MPTNESSSAFTNSGAEGKPFGPPLIGALLRIPWEAVQQHMLERLHERGFDDFDRAYFAVFRFPGPHGARPTDLAARVGISKQALNYLLGQLERNGYLQRRDDPHDQRFKRIALTRRGQRAARAMRDIVREVEAEWQQQLGPQRFAELRALLTDLNDDLAHPQTPDP